LLLVLGMLIVGYDFLVHLVWVEHAVIIWKRGLWC